MCIRDRDNPRTEKPEDIIKAIEEGISKTKGKYEVVVDRTEAIEKAIKIANKRDIIILAGKGHEKMCIRDRSYQIFYICKFFQILFCGI